MRIWGYTITRKPFWKGSTLSWVLFCFACAALFQAITYTHYFAPYRYGEAIIPKSNELVKSGPYFMKAHRTRSFYDIEFILANGSQSYVVDEIAFPSRVKMVKEVEDNNGHAVAFLWVYQNNPVRKVWRVDIGDKNVLDYGEVLKDYKAKSEISLDALYCSIVGFVFFFMSLVKIKRS